MHPVMRWMAVAAVGGWTLGAGRDAMGQAGVAGASAGGGVAGGGGGGASSSNSSNISGSSNSSAPRAPVVVSEAALRLHRSALVFDGHNDLPGELRDKSDSAFEKIDIARSQPQLHTDIPRLRAGGVGAQFWSAYVPSSTMQDGGGCAWALEQIDLIHRMVRRYPDTFEMATTADDVERIHRAGRIASLIGVEGGHAIENSPGVLRAFHALGVRYMTLTHWKTTDWADAATDAPRHGGLSELGERIILEMNRLGMLADISHVSPDTMLDVLRVSRAPVIASHSSACAVAAHVRNVPDEVLRLIPANGGVIMVNFYPAFIEPEAVERNARREKVKADLAGAGSTGEAVEAALKAWDEQNPLPRGTVHRVVDHIDHVVRVAGIDHVGLGSDFDGVPALPEQLEDVSYFPFITQELLNRGYDEPGIRKILGGNVLRALRAAEAVARSWDPNAGRTAANGS